MLKFSVIFRFIELKINNVQNLQLPQENSDVEFRCFVILMFCIHILLEELDLIFNVKQLMAKFEVKMF